jgi:hypothetical protein
MALVLCRYQIRPSTIVFSVVRVARSFVVRIVTALNMNTVGAGLSNA